ncbi:uncharacterized protein LOC135330164 [Dromaius novaehollandiae]|uniref:uncharacterized protein LOC135330164 n=1 Tax=Dromaius novaehollandiae TaxID=8790 RepID=UPI00311DD564
MLSTKKNSTSILTLKEILENGFVAGASSHSHSSPVHSYYMDSSSASKLNTWELFIDLDNTAKGSSLYVVKQSESLNSCLKTDLHGQTQGVSDSSLFSFCKTPHGQTVFDLSGLTSEHPNRGLGCHSMMDVVLQNTSTPCKTEKHSKPLENLLSKSTELVTDISTVGKPPAPRWEISEIKVPLDTNLSLDVSAEELRLLGCSKPDTPSLDTSSVVIPLAWPGAFKRCPALIHRSSTCENQPSDPEPVSGFLHQVL